MDSSDNRNLEQDIVELQSRLEQMQAQLAQAQKMSSVGVLASSITHEFNNILMTIINYAKMGLRHQDDATRHKAFDKILAAGQRASRITTGMLAYARNQSDRREPNRLVALVQDVLVLAEKDLQVHRVHLETDFADDPCAVVNPSQIQQVLLNLIINARQAMSGGGTLTIGVRRNVETRTAEVSVSDTGSGIAQDKLRHIFAPFYSTKTADAQGQGGTGLGLALCRDIIEAHRGRIRVESAVGCGTTFTLKFPDATPTSTVAPTPAALQCVK
ncbi:MAG: sensor histidine kinase [Planctomycetaceae bacterium]